MTIRVRGGTAGILAALATGRLDPLDASLPEERHVVAQLTAKEWRDMARRERRRSRKLAIRFPF